MISLEPYIAAPYAGTQAPRIMKTLAPMHRKAVNIAAHTAAMRFEMETRKKWIQELTEALETGATFADLQERITKLGF